MNNGFGEQQIWITSLRMLMIKFVHVIALHHWVAAMIGATVLSSSNLVQTMDIIISRFTSKSRARN